MALALSKTAGSPQLLLQTLASDLGLNHSDFIYVTNDNTTETDVAKCDGYAFPELFYMKESTETYPSLVCPR